MVGMAGRAGRGAVGAGPDDLRITRLDLSMKNQ
jgi:hypothetical protein